MKVIGAMRRCKEQVELLEYHLMKPKKPSIGAFECFYNMHAHIVWAIEQVKYAHYYHTVETTLIDQPHQC